MKPQTGDILLVLEGRWPLAKIIQGVTRSKAHHTGIIVEIGSGLYVSEMEATGHIFTRWDGAKYNNGKPRDRTLVLMRYKGQLDKAKLVDWCMSNTGEYDFQALVKHIIHRYLKIWIGRRSAKAARRLTCSEWTAYTYNTFTGLFRQWWEATPADIATLHSDQFELFTV